MHGQTQFSADILHSVCVHVRSKRECNEPVGNCSGGAAIGTSVKLEAADGIVMLACLDASLSKLSAHRIAVCVNVDDHQMRSAVGQVVAGEGH